MQLAISYMRAQAWSLTEMQCIVLLDADTIVVSNIDDLCERCAAHATLPLRAPVRSHGPPHHDRLRDIEVNAVAAAPQLHAPDSYVSRPPLRAHITMLCFVASRTRRAPPGAPCARAS